MLNTTSMERGVPSDGTVCKCERSLEIIDSPAPSLGRSITADSTIYYREGSHVVPNASTARLSSNIAAHGTV